MRTGPTAALLLLRSRGKAHTVTWDLSLVLLPLRTTMCEDMWQDEEDSENFSSEESEDDDFLRLPINDMEIRG